MAARAGAKDVDCVAGLGESVLFGNLVCPFFDALGLDLDGLAAGPADQVMVVVGCAGAVEQFAILGLQGICVTACGQVGQGAINRGQADCAAEVSQYQVKLLRANEADGLTKCVPDGVFLARVPALGLIHVWGFAVD